MSRFAANKIGDGSHYMVVFGHHHTGFDPLPQAIMGRLCHLPGRFARSYQQNSAWKFPTIQGTAYRFIRQNRFDRCGNDGVRMRP
jgi:hypothetical protein